MSLGIQRCLVVFAHPSRASLNGAILDAFLAGLGEAGIESRVRDLNAIGFGAVLTEEERIASFGGVVPPDCQAEQEHVLWADALAWIYPAWNFSMPAILKGYIDRAFLIPGFAFRSDPSGVDYLGGNLTHKRAQIIQTLGSSLDSAYRYNAVSTYVQGAVSTLQYAGIRDVQVEQLFNLYRETEKDSPGIVSILTRARTLGRTMNNPLGRGIQTASTSPRD